MKWISAVLFALLLSNCSNPVCVLEPGVYVEALSFDQTPGDTKMLIPADRNAYRNNVELWLTGDRQATHPIHQMDMKQVKVMVPENEGSILAAAKAAGTYVSLKGDIVTAETKGKILYITLQAHEDKDALEIAICEPIVRSTLQSFPEIDGVIFPG